MKISFQFLLTYLNTNHHMSGNSQNAYFYRPQRSWGKVTFQQARVILFTVVGEVPGGNPPGMATAAGGTHPTGMHSRGISF